MNQLISFNFNQIEVRTSRTETGEPLFCLADICKCLELTNPSMIASQICEEFGCPKLNLGHIFDAFNREQEANFITEPQLYFVMMRSRSEHAREFRQWVCNEVLPSIRKTGSYSTQSTDKNETERLMSRAKFLLEAGGISGNQLMLALDKLHKNKTGESLLALTGTQLIAPQNEHLYNPTELGAMLTPKMKGADVNKKLKALGLQFDTRDSKNRIQWNPTPAGIKAGGVMLDVGKAHSTGKPIRHLHWTLSILEYLK